MLLRACSAGTDFRTGPTTVFLETGLTGSAEEPEHEPTVLAIDHQMGKASVIARWLGVLARSITILKVLKDVWLTGRAPEHMGSTPDLNVTIIGPPSSRALETGKCQHR